MDHLVFELPEALFIGIPAAALLILLFGWQFHQSGEPVGRWVTSLILRGMALLILIGLLARPVRITTAPQEPARRDLCLLVDRSESMSIDENGRSRYANALSFVRNQLVPGVKGTDYRFRPFLFADQTETAEGKALELARPDGKRTNLARAVLGALSSQSEPPAAVIVLTDGVLTDSNENTAALSALIRNEVPIVAVGFGTELLARSLSILSATAPAHVPPDQTFRVAVQLQSTSPEPIPPFDLLLLRNGQLVERKSVSSSAGARHWQESFEVTEEIEGIQTYTVQLQPPAIAGLHCTRNQASTNVRIGKEKDLRVLFAQGSLTWDYKFIRLAIEEDPLIKMAGVTQTTKQSILHQSIDESVDVEGIPRTLDELSQYRVVVLSNFRADQLSADLQELLERFCSELGGGVLVIGGPDSLDAAWNTAPLGRVLPARIAAVPSSQAAQEFRIQVTPEALSHPVFRITDAASQEVAWSSVPTFTHAARIESLKPGAQVWAVHSSALGQNRQPAILMAQQRYGAGVSAVIGVQTFWRWRLARDSDPEAFNRFWRQLFRYLAEAGQQELMIRVADQELNPQSPVRLILERLPNATAGQTTERYRIQVRGPGDQIVAEPAVELAPGSQAVVEFRSGEPGMYHITASAGDRPVAFRSIEIRETNREMDRPGRDMEVLRHWAGLTGGAAIKAEELNDANPLLAAIRERASSGQDHTSTRSAPVGINWFTWLVLVSLVGAEWLLRKRWDWL